MEIISINPATGQRLAAYVEMSITEITAAIEQAHRAFGLWRRVPLAERALLLRETGRRLRKKTAVYAELMANEMGKPLREGRAEVEKCAWVCDYYAENGARFLESEPIHTDASTSYVAFQPLGVVLAVMPWNFPFWQVFRFLAPALLAGNAALLKHASNVPGCAVAIEALLHEAGFPPQLFRSLLIGSHAVSAVIEHPLVGAVTLTGSMPAGRQVAACAGARIKKCVLELGGSDPYLILEDADLGEAAQACVTGRLINSGQSCIAAKRWIVVHAVRASFEERVTALMKSKTWGSPLDESHDIGPLARNDLRDELHQQVLDSVNSGAHCLLGGYIPQGPGAYYPPSLLTDVRPGMPAFDEELFGPVAAIVPAADEAEAIRLANAGPFGLGAAVFTRDAERGERIAREELDAGCAFVNTYVRSDPRLPFGGVKESGYGRELSGYGIKEFVNIKSIFVK